MHIHIHIVVFVALLLHDLTGLDASASEHLHHFPLHLPSFTPLYAAHRMICCQARRTIHEITLWHHSRYVGASHNQRPFLSVHRIRVIVYWSPFLGPNYGNPHVDAAQGTKVPVRQAGRELFDSLKLALVLLGGHLRTIFNCGCCSAFVNER